MPKSTSPTMQVSTSSLAVRTRKNKVQSKESMCVSPHMHMHHACNPTARSRHCPLPFARGRMLMLLIPMPKPSQSPVGPTNDHTQILLPLSRCCLGLGVCQTTASQAWLGEQLWRCSRVQLSSCTGSARGMTIFSGCPRRVRPD